MSERDSQRDFWDRRADVWERRADSLDVLSDAYGRPAMDALAPQPGERVLDIGCGPGTTALELARRVGRDGEVVGVDISERMVAAARRRAAKAGVTNTRFVVGDAEAGSLGEGFDCAYSRFGVMFFTDPVAAFTNLVRSLRLRGRLGCAVWGPLADNPWMFVPTLAAVPVLQAELTIPGPTEPGPFSLAAPERITTVLGQAGFADVTVERLEGARLITTATADEDLRTLLEVGPLGEAYDAADESMRQEAVAEVIAAIEPYRDGEGWRLPGVAHLITAQRP